MVRDSDKDVEVVSFSDGTSYLLIDEITFRVDNHLAEWIVRVPNLGSESPCNEFPMDHHDGMVLFFNTESLRFIFRVHREDLPVKEVVVPFGFIVPLVAKHFGMPTSKHAEECNIICGDLEMSLSLIN